MTPTRFNPDKTLAATCTRHWDAISLFPRMGSCQHQFLKSFTTFPEQAGDYWWVPSRGSYLRRITVEETPASGRVCREWKMGGSAQCGFSPWYGWFKPVLDWRTCGVCEPDACQPMVRLVQTCSWPHTTMQVSDLIASLEALQAKHGDIDVTVYQYAGGNDELADVEPEFNGDQGATILKTTFR